MLFEFAPVERRQVVAAFDGGAITSDAGALLLGETDRAIGLTGRFASCFVDARTPFNPVLSVPQLSIGETASQADQQFVDLVRDFSELGRPTIEVQEGGIPYLINEFWTSGQRKSHSIHEVSYRACFKAELPEFFIKRLTMSRGAAYDPFMGRGTTLVQAALMGRQPMGNDINPLSVLLTRPRLNPPRLTDVVHTLDQIPWSDGEIEEPELLAFYSPRTLRHICALRRWLLQRGPLDCALHPADD